MNEREPEPRMEPQTPMLPKPLHVQVAKALGYRTRYREWWNEDDRQNVRIPCWCETGFPAPGPVHHRHWEVFETTYDTEDDWEPCQFYDTDWSATGPLIERLQISLTTNGRYWFATTYDDDGEPFCHHVGEAAGFLPCDDRGLTPLIAVCRLIVALAVATPTGKLEMPQ